MKVVLKVKNGVASPKRRSNQKPGQAVSGNPVHFYLPQEIHAKLNEVAVLNNRSLSSVAAEMVEFALDALRDGEAKLGDAGIQRSTHSATDADVAAETLKRIPGPSDKFYTEAYRRNANALNGYKDHVLE